MAKSELFDIPVLGRLLRFFGSFPVKRGEPDRAALKTAAQLLKEGKAVAIFPEGELSETGELQELKSGVALIVRLAAGVPVICCGLRNTRLALPYGKVVPRPAFRHMDAVWGETRTFDKNATTEEILGWATQQLRDLTDEEGL
jgi:1-acyl-sn-glycerol-3-phosphate acyltransferase